MKLSKDLVFIQTEFESDLQRLPLLVYIMNYAQLASVWCLISNSWSSEGFTQSRCVRGAECARMATFACDFECEWEPCVPPRHHAEALLLTDGRRRTVSELKLS